jgi:hypothetical protein
VATTVDLVFRISLSDKPHKKSVVRYCSDDWQQGCGISAVEIIPEHSEKHSWKIA